MIKPPLQKEVKEAIQKTLERGDQKAIAQIRHEDPSDTSRYFNPENRDRESILWLALCEICDGLNTRSALGERWFAIFCRFYDVMREAMFGREGNFEEAQSAARLIMFEILGETFKTMPRSEQIRLLERAEIAVANYRRCLVREETLGVEESSGALDLSQRAS